MRASAPATGIVRRMMPGRHDPFAAYRLLAREGAASVLRDETRARGRRISFVGVAAGEADLLTLGRDGPPATLAAGLRERLGQRAASGRLGWWGTLAYELGAVLQGLPIPPDDVPLAQFAFVDRGIEFDHDRGETTLVALEGAADAWFARAEAAFVGTAQPTPPAPPTAGVWRHDRRAYLDRIRACQDAIRSGDAYQLCLVDEHVSSLAGDPLDVHARLRDAAPSGHGGVLRVGDRWLLSASPEQYLRVDAGGRARTRPMKGTRPRGPDPVRDAALAAELVASEKERAENLMIVDLMRNDLARVSAVGSVHVPELFALETYASAHQLVSTVESRLAGDAIDAMLALFPAGSMTGAPKRSAMRLLADLEGGPRGTYAGVWGRLPLDGTLDLSVVIRGVVVADGVARVGAGGGITALSDPEAEWAEVLLKFRPMARALGIDA